MKKLILGTMLAIMTCMLLTTQGAMAAEENIKKGMEVEYKRNSTYMMGKKDVEVPSEDNLQEYKKRQTMEINEVIKRKKIELTEKTKQIKEQREQCQTQVTSMTAQRQTARKAMMDNCNPKKVFSSEPVSVDEKKMRAEHIKELYKECKVKMKEFETETKKQLLNIKQSCYNKERSVLGLSTSIPYNR